MPGRKPLPAWLPPPHSPSVLPPTYSGDENDDWTNVALLVPDPVSPDEMIFEGIDTSGQPHFTVSEAAKFFFGHNAQWIRVQERLGRIELDGVPVARHRTEKQARYYTLSDIEYLGHALFAHQVISWNQLRYALALLKIQSFIWGYSL